MLQKVYAELKYIKMSKSYLSICLILISHVSMSVLLNAAFEFVPRTLDCYMTNLPYCVGGKEVSM